MQPWGRGNALRGDPVLEPPVGAPDRPNLIPLLLTDDKTGATFLSSSDRNPACRPRPPIASRAPSIS